MMLSDETEQLVTSLSQLVEAECEAHGWPGGSVRIDQALLLALVDEVRSLRCELDQREDARQEVEAGEDW
jgi:hypothetical protein